MCVLSSMVLLAIVARRDPITRLHHMGVVAGQQRTTSTRLILTMILLLGWIRASTTALLMAEPSQQRRSHHHPDSLWRSCSGTDDCSYYAENPPPVPSSTPRRRAILQTWSFGLLVGSGLSVASASGDPPSPFYPSLRQVTDQNTYSALLYTPPSQVTATATDAASSHLLPLIVVLHGAGRNDQDIWTELANPRGEHAGLIPSLIASGHAPALLLNHFAVLAPYSDHRTSFYDDPRSQLLKFVDWAFSPAGQLAGCPSNLDPHRVFLWGFSDGATVTVELLTTGRFAGGVVCSYGFMGTIPDRAVERLRNIPIWVFHSADDTIFPVACSDRLVKRLLQNDDDDDDRSAGSGGSWFGSIVRYSRFESDPEDFPVESGVRGHTMGITASRDPEVYAWLLSLRRA